MKNWKLAAALCASVALPSVASATDLEVTHWWTSGGEAAAVAEFAKAFDATGNKWVDGAIAGSGDTARPIIISRIMGGNPMGATQLNPGKDADELIAAGLMMDLTELATAEDWAKILRPASQLDIVHQGRQSLLRAGQPALGTVDVDQPQGLYRPRAWSRRRTSTS